MTLPPRAASDHPGSLAVGFGLNSTLGSPPGQQMSALGPAYPRKGWHHHHRIPGCCCSGCCCPAQGRPRSLSPHSPRPGSPELLLSCPQRCPPPCPCRVPAPPDLQPPLPSAAPPSPQLSLQDAARGQHVLPPGIAPWVLLGALSPLPRLFLGRWGCTRTSSASSLHPATLSQSWRLGTASPELFLSRAGGVRRGIKRAKLRIQPKPPLSTPACPLHGKAESLDSREQPAHQAAPTCLWGCWGHTRGCVGRLCPPLPPWLQADPSLAPDTVPRPCHEAPGDPWLGKGLGFQLPRTLGMVFAG